MILRLLAVIAVAIAMAGAEPVAAAAAPAADEPAPPGGSWILMDHKGRPVKDEDFGGHFLLIFFGYTFCPDICPTTLQTVSNVLDALGEDAGKIKPLFISVDPERDTAGVLGEYVKAFHPSIIGLTGPRAFVEAAMRKFRVKAVRQPAASGDPNAYSVDHTASIFLMGPDGTFIERLPHNMDPLVMTTRLKQTIAGR